MKHQKYPTILVVLTALLVVAWPRSGGAQLTYTNNNGAITITGYTGPGGQVTIPSTINGYPVTTIASGAFSCSSLTSVTIPNSVTSIGGRAFMQCYGLTNVTLPARITSIGDYVFEGCLGLTKVTIPDSVTSIGERTFQDCGLGSVTIPDSVTSIGDYAFCDCSSLTEVTIGNSVTNLGSCAFLYCSGLYQAYFQGNAPSVDGGTGSADSTVFYDESGTVYYVPGTTGWGATFGGWPTTPALTYYTIDGAITITGCNGSGSQVTIPSTINGYPVTTIASGAFSCSSLTSVTIPNSVTSIGNQTFAWCSSLTRVTIGNGVTNLGSYAFSSCTVLHQAYFQGNAPSVDGIAGSADSTVFSGESGTVYYMPGTTGWGATFGGWPTAPWCQPRPQILGSDYGLGMGSNGFQFTISWLTTNTEVVVEASTNLQDWTPISTNTLVNGTNAFWDSDWTHYPQRFYRVRSP